ncbi:hypothetical protein IFR05_016322 [Cadophora sp. M221]|nr:hypothetical protein IFR05_016322 [Cadophora sp. M221]
MKTCKSVGTYGSMGSYLGAMIRCPRMDDLDLAIGMIRDVGLAASARNGKVKKRVLRKKVQEYLIQKQTQAKQISPGSQSTEDILVDIWSQVSGISAEKISKEAGVLKFVDSITIMRFSRSVRKVLKKDISVTDVIHNTSVQKQAALLEIRSTIARSKIQKRSGPPTAHDMAHFHGEISEAIGVQQLTGSLLAKLDLTWEQDVEDVMPAPDTLSIIFG